MLFQKPSSSLTTFKRLATDVLLIGLTSLWLLSYLISEGVSDEISDDYQTEFENTPDLSVPVQIKKNLSDSVVSVSSDDSDDSNDYFPEYPMEKKSLTSDFEDLELDKFFLEPTNNTNTPAELISPVESDSQTDNMTDDLFYQTLFTAVVKENPSMEIIPMTPSDIANIQKRIFNWDDPSYEPKAPEPNLTVDDKTVDRIVNSYMNKTKISIITIPGKDISTHQIVVLTPIEEVKPLTLPKIEGINAWVKDIESRNVSENVEVNATNTPENSSFPSDSTRESVTAKVVDLYTNSALPKESTDWMEEPESFNLDLLFKEEEVEVEVEPEKENPVDDIISEYSTEINENPVDDIISEYSTETSEYSTETNENTGEKPIAEAAAVSEKPIFKNPLPEVIEVLNKHIDLEREEKNYFKKRSEDLVEMVNGLQGHVAEDKKMIGTLKDLLSKQTDTIDTLQSQLSEKQNIQLPEAPNRLDNPKEESQENIDNPRNPD